MGHNQTKDANCADISIEQVETLYSFLQGNEVEGITCQHMPRHLLLDRHLVCDTQPLCLCLGESEDPLAVHECECTGEYRWFQKRYL